MMLSFVINKNTVTGKHCQTSKYESSPVYFILLHLRRVVLRLYGLAHPVQTYLPITDESHSVKGTLSTFYYNVVGAVIIIIINNNATAATTTTATTTNITTTITYIINL